ncbi:hypothetical protein [Pinibacter aurantiacus]|uniref:Uncharacterized protein n=1 Tax=Pinibacter aurantiacus TaxID=2851599 RepID=A0A9E2SFB1_9BACT|nr:hypothetical protein [Pinibacter aurantiacus]MBV4360652.1 hypothetical protein [Pinibacter aurantiacus]
MLFTIILWGRFVTIPNQIKRDNLFYKSEINNGIIKYAEPGKGTSRFKIEGRDTVYEFQPKMHAILNGERSFYSVAEPGDTVIKHAYSDTLTLIHKRSKYQYLY